MIIIIIIHYNYSADRGNLPDAARENRGDLYYSLVLCNVLWLYCIVLYDSVIP